MVALLSSRQLGEMIDADIAEIEALNAFAESEKRELTSDEADQQAGLMDRIEKRKARMADAKRFESWKDDSETKQAAPPLASQRAQKSYDEPQWEIPYQARTSRKLQAFKGQYAVENAYAAGHQIKAQLGIEESARWCEQHGIKNAQTGSSTTGGGFTVPDPLGTNVVEFRERAGVMRQIAALVPMSDSDSLAVPVIDSGQTVYYPDQAAAITASDLVFSQVALAAKKRATLTKIARELSNDSLINFADRVASRAGYQLALREDVEAVSGDGSGSYGSVSGIESAMGAAGEVAGAGNAWSELTLANFHDLIAKLPDEHHDGAKFICSRAIFHGVVQKLIFASGGTTADELAGGGAQQIMGYPVVFTPAMPTAEADSQRCIFLGNFQNAVMIGDREGVDVAVSEDFSFNLDCLDVRVVARYDIQVHAASSASAAKAIVGLETAAS